MKITNIYNLPEALVKACENDGYNPGQSDYTTTQLAAPSRQVVLIKRHWHEIEVDVSDMIYALLGKLGHLLLEQSGTAKVIEKRYYREVNGFIISGQVDLVDDRLNGNILQDWKFTSTSSVSRGVKQEWISQASVNRYLCHHNDVIVDLSEYIAIFRDHSKLKAEFNYAYPPPAQKFHVPMWPLDVTERWIIDRVESHENAKISLPDCTMDERWSSGDRTAVMKRGNKTALKLFDEPQEALTFISTHKDKDKLSTEPRPGKNVRCQHYCYAMPFCDQAKRLGIFPEPKPEPKSDNIPPPPDREKREDDL